MGDHANLIQSKQATLDGEIAKQNAKLKLFISYSHQDNSTENQYIEEFNKHLAPLKNMGLIEVWYDHSILPSEAFHKKIAHNLENADVICLFVSANYLQSESCVSEKKKAFELRKRKEVPVISIILSPCGWQDDTDISELLALPTDGKPVSDFKDRTTAWQDVYVGLKRIIVKLLKIKHLKLNKEFKYFLHDTEMLTKAHPKKENVSLDDIYICTELDKYDPFKKDNETINSNELLDHLFTDGKIIVAGEDQSGKTTLCKKIFCELRCLNFIPVYVTDKKNSFAGKMENIISKSLHEQYENIDEKELEDATERIIPIVDDFHHAKNKEKHIKRLSNYSRCIVIVDDIFGLNIKDETIISSFAIFRIKELKSSLRYELIKKWVSLTDKNVVSDYKNIDKNTELINATLGRNMGKGLMPAYPFFILSTIVTYETFTLSLDQDITSQGYCYQAFIYYYLRKRGVKNDEIDIYMNFLTELASYMYKEKREELNPNSFSSFMKIYSEKYNLPIEEDVILTNLSEIISDNCFKNYSFRYPCFYYFFVAKSLSEHIGVPDAMEKIRDILNNLHVDENAYIAVFLTHHSKNIDIFNEIENIALSLFGKYKPATLTKDEMRFFDEQAHNIIKAALPPANVTPEMERTGRLKIQDELEQSHSSAAQEDHNDENDTFAEDFRKAIKTVEVMGCIIRNRAGSLEKVRLRKMFMNGMNVHLRMLSSFFELIQSENEQKEIVDLISKRLSHLEEDKDANKMLSGEKKRKFATTLFWNVNFFILYGFIYKIVHSLGSDKLTEITVGVCDEIDTPASFLTKHGILMDYNKNLQVEVLGKMINGNDFSEIVKRAIRLMVVNHCSLHRVDYRERQRIESCLEVPQKKLLPRNL